MYQRRHDIVRSADAALGKLNWIIRLHYSERRSLLLRQNKFAFTEVHFPRERVVAHALRRRTKLTYAKLRDGRQRANHDLLYYNRGRQQGHLMDYIGGSGPKQWIGLVRNLPASLGSWTAVLGADHDV